MNETPHVFGQHENLYGVHCGAASNVGHGDSRQTKPVVLMLTAGMLSSAGPMRLHVHLARSLAEAGIPSFRFDLSGIGESLPVASQGTSLQRSSHEVNQAINLLAREYGYGKFMLFGLCSGADDAIEAALQNERITAVALMDGLGYRTGRYYLSAFRRKYLPKILSLNKWKELLVNKFWNRKETSLTMPLGSDIREFPARDEAADSIRKLADQNVQLKFVYTGGVMDYYSYARQFYDVFPELQSREEISVEYYPQMDHVLMLNEDRSEIVQRLTRWYVEQVGKTAEHSPTQTDDSRPNLQRVENLLTTA